MMDQLASMRIFCAVVDMGGFAAAAERLSQSTSVVSRAVAQLEAHLKTRLLQRTTRRFSLTESGRAFYERCVLILQDVADLELTMTNETTQPKGVIRLTAPTDLAMGVLSGVFQSFLKQYPDVQLDLVLSEQMFDLVADGFDVAIRIGSTGSDQLVAKQIGTVNFLCAASPDYLSAHAPIEHPRDLEAHHCLIRNSFTGAQPVRWQFVVDGKPFDVKVPGYVQANQAAVLVELAAQGAGIVRGPCYLLMDYIQSGRLQKILLDYPMQAFPIYVVYPSRKYLSAKVRIFIDYVVNEYAQHLAKKLNYPFDDK